MTIYNLGSINIDHFYDVPHLPAPGETLAASGHRIGLGGKGANQSIAAALASAAVRHIGTIGPESDWILDQMRGAGVDCTHIARSETPTAHAIINVDPLGENAIVIFSGANLDQSLTRLETALDDARPGDTLMLQNETNLTVEAARIARQKRMRVIYSAAPFDARAVTAILPYTDMLVMNAVEQEQLRQTLGPATAPQTLITNGAHGATLTDTETGENHHTPAFPVTPVDTTGAGDCFIGYAAAGLDLGLNPADALRRAAAASAIQITRPGTADAIPKAHEVSTFLTENP